MGDGVGNADRTKQEFMSGYQTKGHCNYIKVANKSFENVAEQNRIHKAINSTFCLGVKLGLSNLGKNRG
jgi:hypothetical protein